MIFAVKLKRRMTSASILSIMIGKFCYRKKPYLVILFEIDKSLKINFYHTVLLFSLTIHL